jgi:1-pyrroline-5-carboxylate dehydrogenase
MALPPYRPEPYVDFSQPEVAQKMRDALALVKSQLGETYPLIVDGKKIETDELIASVNPAKPDEVVGKVGKADMKLAEKAVQSSYEAFQEWRFVDPDARARILLRASHIMRRRIYELTAWMVYEVSKPWLEGYADVAEAIDFLEFYAREMMRLGGPQPVHYFPGEENELRFIPLGPVAVIPPWNFACAIMAGMTSAALVTGNTVNLKPASTSPIIAYKFVEILHEAGMPERVLNFIPGPGGAIGDTMVDHPKTAMIAFTGSKEVGLRISERAGKVHEGQLWLKRLILEMGGKDFVAVDKEADLDSAAAESVKSAFGFQGQKCSAGSRLIVHQDVYDDFMKKVVEEAGKLTVGNTTQDNYNVGAVIDGKAHQSIAEYIEVGKKEGKVAFEGSAPEDGYFIKPTVFRDIDRNARIAQEEIFGPVTAAIKAKDFDDIVEIANGTEYGLTGALFTKNRSHIERGRRELHVGNLYFNRKCTGALVGVQPFGGFNMSGNDSKAGGSDYLPLFMQAKSITERF